MDNIISESGKMQLVVEPHDQERFWRVKFHVERLDKQLGWRRSSPDFTAMLFEFDQLAYTWLENYEKYGRFNM